MNEFVPAGKFRVLRELDYSMQLPGHRSGNTFVQLFSCAYPRQLRQWLADNPPAPGKRYVVATIKIVKG